MLAALAFALWQGVGTPPPPPRIPATDALEHHASDATWAEARLALENDPHRWGPYRRLIDAAFAGGRVRDAEALLRQMAADPGRSRPLAALGLLQGREARWTEAVDALRAARERDPSSYRIVRQWLDAARAAGALTQEQRKIARMSAGRAVRQYALGYAAALSYDWSAAERRLRDSFAATPSLYPAAALVSVYYDTARLPLCVDWANAALKHSDVDSDPAGLTVDLLLTRGSCRANLDDLEGNRQDIAEALRVATAAGDLAAQARALRAKGITAHNDAHSLDGLAALERAVAIDERLGEHRALAYDLFMLSYAIASAHPFVEKLPVLDRSLDLAERVHDRQLEARVYGNRGASLLMLGRHGEALRDLLAAETGLKAVGATRSRPATAGNLTVLFAQTGDYDRAEQYGRKALALYRRAGGVFGVAMSTADLGDIALRRGDPAAGLVYHQRAVEIVRRRPERLTLRGLLVRVGRDYLALGRHQPAEQAFRESLAVSEASGESTPIAEAHAALGDLFRQTRRDAEAAHAYERALALSTGGGSEAIIHVAANHGLGLVLARQGRPAEALERFRAALDRIERIRTATEIADLQMLYFADKRAVYLDAIETLVQQHRVRPEAGFDRDAFDLAERARARTLLDTVGARDPGNPVSAALPAVASAMASGDLLLEFALGHRGSFLFVVDEGRLRVHALPPRADIDRRVRAFRRLLAERPAAADAAGAGANIRAEGARLLQVLAGPELDRIGDARRLLIVADGPLLYVPFDALALPRQSRYLGATHQIVTAPSAGLLARSSPRPFAANDDGELVAFGDPASDERGVGTDALRRLERAGFSFGRLPGARREVLELGALFGPHRGRVYTGRQFTRQTVVAELEKPHRFVHFATHAVLDERQPARSGIVVSSSAERAAADGIIQVDELATLRIQADLVTLSACQTALGRVIDGEGVLGLARALQGAGARSLVATLWSVSDVSTTRFMVVFYRALRDGASASAALLSARQAMLRDPNPALHHPYYWAAYTLIGSAR